MQIRQLEALQGMAKSANSKVIFVPMSLVGDGPSDRSFFNAETTQPAILNSMADI